MGKPIKYSNDRSFDNLLLILMHTYMDLKTLSSQVDISKNYLKTKIDCLEDVREAYFLKTEISQKEWDGVHYPNFFPKEPRNRWEKDKAEEMMRIEYNLFHQTLTLAQDHYYKLARGSNISEDDPRTNVDIKKLRKSIQSCIESIQDPPFYFYKWNPIFE